MDPDNFSLLKAVFCHTVLPPKLPGAFDGDSVELVQDFGARLKHALSTFKNVGDENVWARLHDSLETTKAVNRGYLDKNDLLDAFKHLATHQDNTWLGVHVTQQNAAIVIHRDTSSKSVIFESFQTTAPVRDVLEASHALTWDFPSRAVTVPLDVFNHPSFLSNLSSFLEQGSTEAFDLFAARANKGGRAVVEIRDCPSSALVNDMLMSLLEGLGSPTTVDCVRKKVNDDVVLDTSDVPWRRSPYWLMLRITLRRLLCSFFEETDKRIGRVYYKFVMCAFLANLLSDCATKLEPEMTLILQAKLCRRLAKLDTERLTSSGLLQLAYNDLFTASKEPFNAIVTGATRIIYNQWDEHKKRSRRRIPRLLNRAPDSDLSLTLSNSRSILERLLSQEQKASHRELSFSLPSLEEGTVSQISKFAAHYSSIVDHERQVASMASMLPEPAEQACIKLSHGITSLLAKVGDAYKDEPLMISRHILQLFELWIAMDQAAIKACPLLKQFHPVFVPGSLDILCLLTKKEMEQLGCIQQYLNDRVTRHQSDHKTIFSNPRQSHSFPMQFISSTKLGEQMMRLGEEIDDRSERAKDSKASELANLTNQYNQLSQSIKDLTCTCRQLPTGEKDYRGCKRCWKWRCRRRLKINIHEDFLPLAKQKSKKAHRDAILFESLIPEYLVAYRKATWKLYMLGSLVIQPTREAPKLLLSKASGLKTKSAKGFVGKTGEEMSITLASRKESFRQTHYNMMKLPKQPAEVLLPFGAEFTYYDTASGLWADQLPKVPWFQHLLGPWLPPNISDPYEHADMRTEHDLHHPSSYEILAEEPNCPSNMSVHEFSAFQRAVSGRGRRWPVLLVELASSNMNLSSEATNALLNRLALQAGPAVLEKGLLREAHSAFLDPAFCERLQERLNILLDALTPNWREAHCMGSVVVLSLRLYHFCPERLRSKAKDLLLRIRAVTTTWMTKLRQEIRSTANGEAAEKAATLAFWAALNCRQTFSVNVNGQYDDLDFSKEDALCFFRASIALQENLLVNLDRLSPILKRLLIQDVCTSYLMRNIIKRSVQNHHKLLEDAINETWTSGGRDQRRYSPWEILPQPNEWWARSLVSKTRWTATQVIHYHLLQGHLIVDGKPLGRLPLEMREDSSIQELFKNQHLLTRPSSILDYQLVSDVEQHHIHFGLRNERVIIRAFFRDSLLEHVPRDVFKGAQGWDLPADLIDDCVHWLNLSTGTLEIRRKPKIWRPKPSNWVLDIRSRTAVRRNKASRARSGRTSAGTYLVEQKSDIGRQISGIFHDFEDTRRLTIYQPAKGPLSVEMKRLEIRFSVNDKGLLECPQLRAEVDPWQDVGTLHGLSSLVVLRDRVDREKQSVIVPTGDMSWERRGIHVAVRIANHGMYTRYTINPLLGRLDCPYEPALLYLKAALHALTSFALPDELTRRTGTEEARHTLLSARAQPWTPLMGFSKHFLSIIRSLSPDRQLYPPGIELYQRVEWDRHLTMTIQHEDLATLVDGILLQSQKLETFHDTTVSEKSISSDSDSARRLRLRGRIRRQLYERVCFHSDATVLEANEERVHFIPSKQGWALKASHRVYQTVRALQEHTTGVTQLPQLVPIMENWESIAGFGDVYHHDIATILGLDMSQLWGSLVETCRKTTQASTYDGYFSLALSAFHKKVNMDVVRWLVALYKTAQLKDIEVPRYPSFTNFHAFEEPAADILKNLVLGNLPSYNSLPRKKRTQLSVEMYERIQVDEASLVVSIVTDNWPAKRSLIEQLEVDVKRLPVKYTDLDKAWSCINLEIQRLSRNFELSKYLHTVSETAQAISDHQSLTEETSHTEVWDSKPTTPVLSAEWDSFTAYRVPYLTDGLMLKGHCHPSSGHQLNQGRLSMSGTDTSPRLKDNMQARTSLQIELKTLNSIVRRLSSSPEPTRRQYGKDLEASLTALIQSQSIVKNLKEQVQPVDVDKDIPLYRQILHGLHEAIRNSIASNHSACSWLTSGNLWPCLSPVALLELLRSCNESLVSVEMRKELIQYGICTTMLQRLFRMRDAAYCNDEARLFQEQEQKGHSNWNPLDHPEWLLLEIDNNMLIRPSQTEVARAIISPASGSNSVLQMNMGQGKTSCIMPMAVTQLADKTRLCRLIVPRALLLQTAQVIQSRLGGLVGRTVCHIPFIRRSPTQEAALNVFHNLHQNTLATGGVMLCLPEHILSFKLSGIQQLVDKDFKRARKMISIQNWLERSCRDVLDESDFTLSTKTQLIYPSGVPEAVDGHPQRWQVIQELLLLVETHLDQLQAEYGDGIQIRRRHQGYPIIHFLDARVEDGLKDYLVQDICQGRLPQLQLKSTASIQDISDIESIVSGAHVPLSTWKRAAGSLQDDVFGWKNLHLLRGLISQRILISCLKKRWNVQYGLHPERAPIAVPFDAKGIPSLTAEYGHPDTALVLTCLALYQTGLTRSQVAQCLEHIVRSDDPVALYERLAHSCELPADLQHWNLIDTGDEEQMAQLWNCTRFNRDVLNYFLNTFAFPTHAKQFGVKLQASGWDIPLLSNEISLSSQCLTTGFSGTNDNKRLLPHTITQHDLPSLLQTNAEVLSYLLHPRNQTCYQSTDRNGQRLTERGLLELLNHRSIRILIDAGAYVLEMQNKDLAATWLDVDHEAQGAVYFDHNSRLMVRARFQKEPVPLVASPFADNLRDCVVYIDEAHTRGTDLKLPIYARGAVTLGLGQTKDQTVQAAMRLRQLGSTQSVAFIAPPEVYQSITTLRNRESSGNSQSLPVTTSHVVQWLLEQSCRASEDMTSLHIAQGFDFCRRTNALWKHAKSIDDGNATHQLVRSIQQRDGQTLEMLYGPRQVEPLESTTQFDFTRLQEMATGLSQQRLDSWQPGRSDLLSAFEEVEQEREVEFEVEQIREKQKLERFVPLAFRGLDKSLVKFVETGKLDLGHKFVQAFEFIGTTRLGRQFNVKGTSSKLFISKEFSRIINNSPSRRSIDVVRPVEWVLWSTSTETALIVIPEEAELLILKLRTINQPLVFLAAYAAPVTRPMQLFNTLAYLTIPSTEKTLVIPSWLSIELGVFAGRLYFHFDEYKPLLNWLGPSGHDASCGLSELQQTIGSTTSTPQGLQAENPLQFLSKWLTYRRRTLDIMHTPMGYVCQNRILRKTHPFFVTTKSIRAVGDASSAIDTTPVQSGYSREGLESDDDSEWGEELDDMIAGDNGAKDYDK